MKKWLLAFTTTMFAFPAFGAPAYVGVWAESQERCAPDGDQVPIDIREGAIQFYETECRFQSVLPDGNTWMVRAECSSEGETWTSHYGMTVSGDKLLFVGGDYDGRQYVRCRE